MQRDRRGTSIDSNQCYPLRGTRTNPHCHSMAGPDALSPGSSLPYLRPVPHPSRWPGYRRTPHHHLATMFHLARFQNPLLRRCCLPFQSWLHPLLRKRRPSHPLPRSNHQSLHYLPRQLGRRPWRSSRCSFLPLLNGYHHSQWRSSSRLSPVLHRLCHPPVRAAAGNRAARNLCIGALLEAVRDRSKTVSIKQVNCVLMQPHWRHEREVE